MKICERIEARRSPARRLPWRARMGRAAVASCASMLLWFSAAASAQDGPEAERPEEPAAETAPAETAPAETAPAEGAGEVEAATEGEATVPEVAPVPKPPVRPPVLPCPPAGAPQYHMVFRPAVWIPISRTVFRKGVGGTVFSLEDDKHPFLDARGIHLLFPVEAMFRSDSKEFKIRYVHWENYATNGLSGGPALLNFGGVDFSGRVSARLQTDVLGLDFHQNL